MPLSKFFVSTARTRRPAVADDVNTVLPLLLWRLSALFVVYFSKVVILFQMCILCFSKYLSVSYVSRNSVAQLRRRGQRLSHAYLSRAPRIIIA